jgi:5-methylcytosine-specific restriction endonuclease McrA
MMRLRSWDARLCDHLRHEVRQRIDAAGRPFYQNQCLDCGARLGTAVAAAKALADGRQPAPFDEDLYEYGAEKLARNLDEQRAALNRAIDERWAEKRLAYDAYLVSEAWRNKRAEALRRDEGVCQGCRARPATQVHHLTYAHLGDELLLELISVCDDCHERIHAAPTTTEGLGA